MPASVFTPFEAKHPSDVIGNWGPAQRTIVIVISITYMVAPFSNSILPLYAPKQNFTCNHYDDVSGTLLTSENACEIKTPSDVTIKCTNFTYDTSFYQRTMISQFDLVCDRAWYASFSQSLHQVGYGVSGVVLGYMSDRFGRLFAARTAILLEIAAGFGQAFAPNITIFWISRFFIGVAAYGRYLTGFVMVTEWIGPKLRAKFTIVTEFMYQIAYPLLLLFYYNVPDYKIVQTTASTVEIGIFFMYLFFMSESPRWLMTHSKTEEVDKLLTKAAKAKNKLPEDEIKRRITSLKRNAALEIDAISQKQTVFDIWKEPILFRLSLILYFTWFTHAFIGYASALNVENLGGGLFTSLTVMTFSGLAENTMSYFLINRVSRKKALVYGMWAESLATFLLLLATYRSDWYVFRLAISIFGRMSGGFVIAVYYLYTAETFPTAMRQAGLGSCSVFARIGSSIAPFIKELTNYTHLAVPTAIFLTLNILNALVIMLVPDTGKIQVADTIKQKKKEVEARADRSMSIVSGLSLR